VTRQLLLSLLAVSAGVGIGALVVTELRTGTIPEHGTSQRSKPDIAGLLKSAGSSELSPTQLAQIVESLVQVLDEEIAERRLLAEQLEATQAELADLRQNLRGRVESAFESAARDQVESDIVASNAESVTSVEERMVAAGFTMDQQEQLRRREAEAVMEQIQLDDRARREGWFGTPRYYSEFEQLASGAEVLRNELGDDGYDRYLYANRRPNRIAVASVIQTSPAEQAGLRAGDVITRYGGDRIFATEQLSSLRSSGDPGAPVVVEIIRDGQPMQITMPRGPMGITTQPSVADPALPAGR
jgi:C-terminal processing protease CtpA/Prc